MRDAKFSKEQLLWLEEYPDCFVEVLKKPKGELFQLDGIKQVVQIRTLTDFIARNYSYNLWRSWDVYRDHELNKVIGPVPLVIDIDDESTGKPNLLYAHELTRICLDVLLQENNDWSRISTDHLRVVFSGYKGFHIEIKPPCPIDAQIFRRYLIASCVQREEIHQSTVIDVFHDHIRLTDSINSWINSENEILSRKVFQMTVSEFNKLNLEEIIKYAKVV